MARKQRPRERKPHDEGNAFRSTLGDLLQQAGLAGTDEGEPQAAPVEEIVHNEGIDLSCCAKITIRLERKGRRGKVVTLVEGLSALSAENLKTLAQRWRQRLGCGATVEPDRIVLQGDQRDRVEPLVTEAGG